MGRRPAFEEVEGLGGGPSNHRACERGAQNLSPWVYPRLTGPNTNLGNCKQSCTGPRSCNPAAHDMAPLEGQAPLPGRLLDAFTDCRVDDWERFCAVVTDWEIEQYLTLFP